jgi:hypothetical protein
MTGATITEAGTPAATSLPSASRRRAGVDACEVRIERRHRQRHLDQIALRHAGENVEIAQDERRLGHDADRMAVTLEHLQDVPHHLMLPLDRLVGIGIGADGDGAGHVAGGRKLALEELRRVRLGKQLGFEVEAGREAEIGVGRPRKAVDAAVLAAAIGIDGAIEGDVG